MSQHLYCMFHLQSNDEALWKACYDNREDQIRKILSKGANPNWKNREHNVSLRYIISCNYDFYCVQEFLLS